MQLLQIKKLGPGKFYISNKKELGFIGGNPSSYKGWMSRYFFIKRISGRENPWDCDMSWRDNAYTLPPPSPEHRPDLAKFLDAMSGKCFNAQELIEEDILCHFIFSEMMSKAEMMKALKEKKTDPEGTSLSLSKGKRKASEEGGERRKKRHHEKKTKEPARETVSGGLTSEPSVKEGKTSEQKTTEAPYVLLDTSAISFVEKPSGSVSLDFTRRLIPDQDFDPLEEMRATSDKEKESMMLELETSRAQALHFEEENKALHTEVDKLKGEAENSWELGKEKFLQSKEFDSVFRANGYSEEEHPAPFLDVERALADMSDDEDLEEGSSGRDEAPPA
ncbi:hypothetical protein F511_15709 [Dorcoceras hygrometricum]|uniref:Uncharacterized protein n=1 Tax=Dorcoceras hygrometricum TaxID=472368 RepID=A0A2Z7BKE8_9LAMI|nr:hypothetical protein F511_15709 [Dorcoceras hygrometricum]